MLRLTFIALTGMLMFSLAAADPSVTTLTAGKVSGRKAKMAGVDHALAVADDASAKFAAEPGRIRIRAFFLFNGKGQAYRQTPFSLSVGEESVSRTVDELAVGMPLELTFVNRATEISLKVQQDKLTPEAKTELLRLESAAGKGKGPELDIGKDEGGKELDLDDTDQKTVDASAAPQPLLLLDRIEVTQLSGPLLIASVKSDKIAYRPDETAAVTVTVENVSSKPAAGKLSVDLVEGLSARKQVFSGEVKVDPGKQARQSFQAPLGTALWGRGLEAKLETPQGTDLATHAVSVVTNPFMAAIFGRGLPQFGSERWTPEQAAEEAEKIAAANMDAYCNVYEAFAWAPCDFSKMTVENEEPFYSGQTQYSKKRSSLEILHKVFHKYGIGCITYGKTCAAGQPGLEYALRHPEQMHVFNPAGFAHESISVDVLDRMLEKRFRRHGRDEDFWQSWISSWIRIGDKAAAEYGCGEIARSANQFGWDGVRYDGHFNCWQNPPMSARMVQYAKDLINRQIPNFMHGYNYCGPQQNTAEGALSDPELAACAKDGGLIMSEYYRELAGPVRDNIEHLRWVGDATRLHGGYFLTISDLCTPWSAALTFAGGARPMGSDRDFKKFATRFSAFILDPAMRRLEDPAKVITPGKNTGFRWDGFVYEKPVSDTESLLVMQLVNVSDKFTFCGKNRPPTGVSGPCRDVEFTFKLPEGYQATGVNAWDASGDFTPMTAKLDGNRLTLPLVDVWTMAVVGLRRNAGTRDLATLCELPWKGAPSDADSKEKSRADLKIAADSGPDAGKGAKSALEKITPAKLAEILAKGEPVDEHDPGEKLYAPPSFDKRKAGVDAGFWKGNAPSMQLRRNGRPDILVVRGVFSHLDRLAEAFAGIPKAVIRDAYLEEGRVACASALSADNKPCLNGWPSRDELALLDAVVLDEIPAGAFTLAQRRDLLDFVKAGGGLFVLGGWYSISKGAWEGSFLEESLPLETIQTTYLLRLKGNDQKVAATPDAKEVLGADLPEFPDGSIEWINPVRPRAGAKVSMKAGAHPLLVSGAIGSGRSLAWCGSHSGTPKSPYWESASWPKLLGAALRHVIAGSETATPPDQDLAKKLGKARDSLVDSSMDEDIDPKGGGNASGGEKLLAGIRLLVSSGNDDDAVLAAGYLLEHPGIFDAAQSEDLSELISPKITASDAWAKLAEKYGDRPPQELAGLATEIVAGGVKSIKYASLMKMNIKDPLARLRCTAVCADPAALPELEAEMKEINTQEAKWKELVDSDNYSTATVHDIYETRLRRPFVAYAMLKCGKRDEETLYQLCRGVLELPYYAWRQRWVLEGAYGSLIDAQRTGDPGTIAGAKGRIRGLQSTIRRLDKAAVYSAQLFTPGLVAADEAGLKAAIRALKEADCRKSLPAALAFLNTLPPEKRPAFKDLEQARLPEIRMTFQALSPAGK